MATYTNFCTRASGSNLNAGTRTGNTTEPGTGADFTYASGNLVAATRVFTVASGNPSTDGVAIGDFVSIYADGSTVTGYVARVTNVTATTITTDATAKSGTIPTDGTGNRTLKVGGAWLGPNGASGFPLTLLTAAATNVAGNVVRINMKNDQTYSVTAAIALAASGCGQISGYASSYADGGRAILDGGTSGAAYALLTIGTTSANNGTLSDLEIKNNGASSNAVGLTFTGVAGWLIRRCVIRDIRGTGASSAVTASPQGNTFVECEFYGCNQANASNLAGLVVSSGIATAIRCIFHDNTGSNTAGLYAPSGTRAINCIFDSNGKEGFRIDGPGSVAIGCDFYNNVGPGLSPSATVRIHAENCNFVKNGTFGVNNPTGVVATLVNCGYGTGTQANASGDVALTDFAQETGAVNYASGVTPWVDPANGDFRLTLAASRGVGRGAFLQTASSYSGTVGYPDIGAAQSLATGGGVTVFSVHGSSFLKGSTDVNPNLEETITLDFVTSLPTTGAASDADSLPTAEVFEDATDTTVYALTCVKRTSKTGNYRVAVACTTANGFEVGKSYNVVASATVGTVAAKSVIGRFQVRLAEDVTINGTVNDAGATTTVFIGDSSLSATDDWYNGGRLVFLTGALQGVNRLILDYTGSSRTITLATALPAAPANTVGFAILGGSG